MTEWNCETVRVTNVRKHPGADTLSIGTVLNGYDVIFKTGDFAEGSPWNKDLLQLSEGKSVMPGAKHCREGIVVKPLVERRSNLIGRVILKLAGQDYLLRKEKNDTE